jgi:hypothetical protein
MMDYDRIKQIAKNHRLDLSYPLYAAMKQASGEAAQEMRARYLDALHNLHLPEEMIMELNRKVTNGPRQGNGNHQRNDHVRVDSVAGLGQRKSNHSADPYRNLRDDDWDNERG